MAVLKQKYEALQKILAATNASDTVHRDLVLTKTAEITEAHRQISQLQLALRASQAEAAKTEAGWATAKEKAAAVAEAAQAEWEEVVAEALQASESMATAIGATTELVAMAAVDNNAEEHKGGEVNVRRAEQGRFELECLKKVIEASDKRVLAMEVELQAALNERDAALSDAAAAARKRHTTEKEAIGRDRILVCFNSCMPTIQTAHAAHEQQRNDAEAAVATAAAKEIASLEAFWVAARAEAATQSAEAQQQLQRNNLLQHKLQKLRQVHAAISASEKIHRSLVMSKSAEIEAAQAEAVAAEATSSAKLQEAVAVQAEAEVAVQTITIQVQELEAAEAMSAAQVRAAMAASEAAKAEMKQTLQVHTEEAAARGEVMQAALEEAEARSMAQARAATAAIEHAKAEMKHTIKEQTMKATVRTAALRAALEEAEARSVAQAQAATAALEAAQAHANAAVQAMQAEKDSAMEAAEVKLVTQVQEAGEILHVCLQSLASMQAEVKTTLASAFAAAAASEAKLTMQVHKTASALDAMRAEAVSAQAGTVQADIHYVVRRILNREMEKK
mmetsp:Transcript_42385/g.70485  ORF Transcript_42385/g.70485 Transcript_42385/m.70485 type:complete len:563 (-) Transcript_42385:210-1898(-)